MPSSDPKAAAAKTLVSSSYADSRPSKIDADGDAEEPVAAAAVDVVACAVERSVESVDRLHERWGSRRTSCEDGVAVVVVDVELARSVNVVILGRDSRESEEGESAVDCTLSLLGNPVEEMELLSAYLTKARETLAENDSGSLCVRSPFRCLIYLLSR